MTMIAIACKGDTAEIMTDSASYTSNGSKFGRSTKVHPLVHLDMAVVTQGDGVFGDAAVGCTILASSEAATFDDLVDNARNYLRPIWKDVIRDREAADSVVFLVGWSERRGKFVAYGFASENDFEPSKLGGMHVMPAPWTVRPSKVELERMRRHPGASEDKREEAARLWQKQPPARAPRTTAEWVELARKVRDQRALVHFQRVFVAGPVMHTRLGRGSLATECIYEYDDSGEEFARMVAYTDHPQAQLVPCHCDSGMTFRECHMAAYYAEHKCGCGSGQEFEDCCAVPIAAAEMSA